jgi:AAA domain
MSLLLTEICVWAAGIPVWEQETLRRLLAEEPFDGEIYSDLASLLLGEKFQDPVDFSGFQARASTTDERPTLLRISCARNVNALATNQTLEFSPGLTVIFGQNGSGKSGYARILGNACFCRGDRDVLPNLFDSVLQNSPQSADVTISVGGRESTIKHDFQNTIAALSGFYVFDSTAVSNHLARENALSFSPFGLSLLGDLVEHTDQVRAIAQSRINAACQPPNFSRLFRGETAISRAIA